MNEKMAKSYSSFCFSSESVRLSRVKTAPSDHATVQANNGAAVAAADACCAQCAIPGAHALNASASATTNAVSVAKSPPRIVPGADASDAGNSRKLVASLCQNQNMTSV